MQNLTEKMLIGRVNDSGRCWIQFNGTAVHEENVYAFIPVNGDATFTTIEKKGVDVSGDNVSGTYYQNQIYTGGYTKLTLASGEILCYLGINA